MNLRFLPWSFALALLVGCSTVSAPHVQRNGNLSPSADAGQAADVAADAARESQGAPQAVIRRGTGTMINREAARARHRRCTVPVPARRPSTSKANRCMRWSRPSLVTCLARTT
jgi:hypothetical protein